MPVKDFEFYKANQSELLEKYNGKFIVIVNQEVVSSHDTEEGAYFDAIGKYKMGTFFIIHCIPGDSSYTQTFHSRVIFV